MYVSNCLHNSRLNKFLECSPILLKQKDLIVFGKQLILSKKQLGLLSPAKGEQTDAN